MSKACSACKDLDLSRLKGTEISVTRFLIEYFIPLTMGEQHQGALSDEDVTEVWFAAKSEAIRKNKKTKHIIMLEFKRTSDTAETYHSDMKSIAERQHTPILEGLNALAEERGWVVKVLPTAVRA